MGRVPDKLFRKQLKESHAVVVMVADWLKDEGYDVRVQTMSVTPSHEERFLYTDDGDIWVGDNGRIEVKYWPNIPFTGRSTCPYSWVFIDEVYQIERHHSRDLKGYVIVNSLYSHVAMIPEVSRILWRKMTKFDSRYKEERTYYAIHKKHVQFASMKRAYVN
jgi:hypothetical protein